MSVKNLTYCGLLTSLLKCMVENLVAEKIMSKINVTLLASRFWVQWEVDNQRTSPPLKMFSDQAIAQPVYFSQLTVKRRRGLENVEFGRIWVPLVLAQSTNNKSPRVKLCRGGVVLFNLLLVVLYLRREQQFPRNPTFRFRCFLWLHQSSSYYVYYRIEYLRRQ